VNDDTNAWWIKTKDISGICAVIFFIPVILFGLVLKLIYKLDELRNPNK